MNTMYYFVSRNVAYYPNNNMNSAFELLFLTRERIKKRAGSSLIFLVTVLDSVTKMRIVKTKFLGFNGYPIE